MCSEAFLQAGKCAGDFSARADRTGAALALFSVSAVALLNPTLELAASPILAKSQARIYVPSTDWARRGAGADA
jgi:hypothetical protein